MLSVWPCGRQMILCSVVCHEILLDILGNVGYYRRVGSNGIFVWLVVSR